MYYRYARMGIYSLCIMACLGLFLSLSCAISFAQKTSRPQLTLTKADSGKTFSVRVGDEIAIKLPENPSTGYTWTIDQTNSNILKSLSSTPASKSSGTRTFLFQALKQGTVHLRLKQRQSREGNKSNADQFNVTINVTRAR